MSDEIMSSFSIEDDVNNQMNDIFLAKLGT